MILLREGIESPALYDVFVSVCVCVCVCVCDCVRGVCECVK